SSPRAAASSSFPLDPPALVVSVIRFAAARPAGLQGLHRSRLSPRVPPGPQRLRRPARLHVRPSPRRDRGRGATTVARTRRQDAPALARAGRGRVLRGVLLRVRHTLLSGPSRVRAGRSHTDPTRARALLFLAGLGAQPPPAAAHRARRRPRNP